jgi:succinyl-CoA synthetase beta subunit
MIAEAVDIVKETYFAILMDRASHGPILLASPMGGMNIESVAQSHPDQIFVVSVTCLIRSF